MKRTIPIAVAVIALGLLGACSAGSGAEKPSTQAAPAELKQVDRLEVARDQLKQGGKLTLALDELPNNWNQLHADGANVVTSTIDELYMPSFVSIKADGTWEPNKDYVSKFELTKDNPQTVSISIRPEAVWSDGTPMTAADIIGTWKADNGSNDAFATASSAGWEEVKSITQGATEKDATVVFKEPYADWPAQFSLILPPSLYSSPEAFNSAAATKPINPSSGPFVVANVDSNAKVVTLKPNPKWWGDKPALDEVNFKVVSRDQLGQAYANGEIDVVEIGSNQATYDTAKGVKDSVLRRSSGRTWNHVTLNGNDPTLSDLKVRHAIAKAINRKLQAESRLTPIGAPVETQGNHIFMNGQVGYVDNYEKIFGYDPEGAGKLLDEAGYVKGSDGMRAKNGTPLKLAVTIPPTPTSESTAKLLQADMKKIGLDLEIKSVPMDKFFLDYVATSKMDFQMTVFAWQGTPFPISSAESLYYPANDKGGDGQNFGGVTDESLGADFAAVNSNLDPDSARKQADAIDVKITELATTLPTFASPYTYAMKPTLANYGPAQFQSTDWTKVGWTK